jgi:hypothetical protein
MLIHTVEGIDVAKVAFQLKSQADFLARKKKIGIYILFIRSRLLRLEYGCATTSSLSEVELRFFPWLTFFKY